MTEKKKKNWIVRFLEWLGEANKKAAQKGMCGS